MSYKQSEHYTLDITLDELFYLNPEVKIDTNYRRNKDDKFVGTMVLYLKRSYSDKRNIVIGITNDGFVNSGTSTRDDLELPIISLDEAVEIMNVYLDLYSIADELESLLVPLYLKNGNINSSINISFKE